jgi:RimJ/RimL family protein N-acetyltransferase
MMNSSDRPLETERLILRPWQERDRDLFFEINSDPEVMQYFPFRRNRKEADAFFDKLVAVANSGGMTFEAVEVRETGECIGFCGLHSADVEPFLPAYAVEIGWRLAWRFWGKGYATEAALRWLDHGFSALGLPEIVTFAVHDNRRSIAVMGRLEMTRDPTSDFDHPRVPDTHPRLKRHIVYRLQRDDWKRKKGGR